jgi:hypothetical protein
MIFLFFSTLHLCGLVLTVQSRASGYDVFTTVFAFMIDISFTYYLPILNEPICTVQQIDSNGIFVFTIGSELVRRHSTRNDGLERVTRWQTVTRFIISLSSRVLSLKIFVFAVIDGHLPHKNGRPHQSFILPTVSSTWQVNPSCVLWTTFYCCDIAMNVYTTGQYSPNRSMICQCSRHPRITVTSLWKLYCVL